MKSESISLKEEIWQFSQNYIKAYQLNKGEYPVAEIDREFSSPCQLEVVDEDKTRWKAVKIEENLDFSNINSALDVDIHSDIESYFCTIFANNIPVKSEDGRLFLLFPWSIHDFQRLQENIIGHIMMKQRLKQTMTIFFAVTDEDDLILSINNETGAIWVEQIGCEPHKKIAENLLEFFSKIEFDFTEEN